MNGPFGFRRRARSFTGLLAGFVLAVVACAWPIPVFADAPTRLTDQEMWKLVSDFSEPNGFFRSDNLLSNETSYQKVIPDLVKQVKPGRVYVGVGPEQNFTYIAATKPAMVFIVDIRRGNLDLQFLYKALFEMSADRAEFASRLFARTRPAGLTTASTAEEIFAALKNAETSDEIYKEHLRAVQEHLTLIRKFPLLPEDLQGIDYAYRAFQKFGPQIQYSSTGSFGGSFQPSYAELMIQTDGNGQARSYLASEDSFRYVRELHANNLLVPVVGNFSGPRAIRAVGQYIRRSGETVSAFYLSNVEQYLRMDGVWDTFCANVATMPLDESSTFIRSVRSATTTPAIGLLSELGSISAEVRNCR